MLLAVVLFICHWLQPINYTFFCIYIDGNVSKAACRRSTVPMLNPWLYFHDIPGMKCLNGLSLFLVVTDAICADKNLSGRMCMPIISCTGFKHYIANDSC